VGLKEAELPERHSQRDFGNEEKRGEIMFNAGEIVGTLHAMSLRVKGIKLFI